MTVDTIEEAKAIRLDLIKKLSDDKLESLRADLDRREKAAYRQFLATRPTIDDEFESADEVDNQERRTWAELSRQLRSVNIEIASRAHEEAIANLHEVRGY
ncbi:MAG: hypothetical protein GC165_07520 [Armatimonadetes bacterium]|nr:hypothetical protein [Armatimonadota bacterium]